MPSTLLNCGAKMVEVDLLNVELLEGILVGKLGLHTLTGLLRREACVAPGGGGKRGVRYPSEAEGEGKHVRHMISRMRDSPCWVAVP